MRKKEALVTALGFFMTVILTALVIALLWSVTGKREESGVAALTEKGRMIVIDAGHGGSDGGAVAPDGTLEKELNLEISRILCALMRVSGYDVVMTRENDVTLGETKMKDLKSRLQTFTDSDGALSVSLHCNKFPDPSCNGLQVYYADTPSSRAAAEAVQAAFSLVSDVNRRQVKKADSSIYLLHRASSPAILVECGFLSNPEELERLKTDEYRKKLALAVMSGVSTFYGE